MSRPRLITITAVVPVPEDYDLDADASGFYAQALALVPHTSFGVVTEGVSEAALALGARHAYPWLAPAPATRIPDGAFLTLDTDGKPPRLHLVWGEPGELAVTLCGRRGIYLDDPNPDYAAASPQCLPCWHAAAALHPVSWRAGVEVLRNVIISERDIGPAHVVCTICDDTLCWAEDSDTFETLTGVALDHHNAKHAGTPAAGDEDEPDVDAHLDRREAAHDDAQDAAEAEAAEAEAADDREAERTGGTFAGKYLTFVGSPGTLDGNRPGPGQFARLLAAIAEVGLNEEQDAELSELLGMSLNAIAEIFDLAREMHEAAPDSTP